MSDPTLYLYTSLTAGSSHIITATSRIETILKANKIPFKAIDCATDDKARMLWGRRSKGRKIPGLVKFGNVIGDLDQIEEWNEYGELKDNIDDVEDIFGDLPVSATTAEAQAAAAAQASAAQQRSQPASRSSSETRHISISDPKDLAKDKPAASLTKEDTPLALAMRKAGAEAAAKAGQKKIPSVSEGRPLPASGHMGETASITADTTIATKLNPDAEEPSAANTKAKVPTLLAAEGAPRISTEKIASESSDSEESTKSNEEQMLEARRSSSITKHKSSLSTQMAISDVIDAEEPKRKEHRGSSLDPSNTGEIMKVEKGNTITEDEEEDNTKIRDLSGTTKKVGVPEEAEDTVLKNTKTQEQAAKEEQATGVNVGD